MDKKIKISELPEFDATRHLEDEEDIAMYLTCVLEENDAALLAAALGDIAKARGMTEVAKKAGITREALSKALRPNASPCFDMIQPGVSGARRAPRSPAHTRMTTLVPNEVVALVFAGDLSPMRAWREHLGLTRAEVATRAGITQAAYAQMETAAKPRATTRKKIAAALGITPEQLNF